MLPRSEAEIKGRPLTNARHYSSRVARRLMAKRRRVSVESIRMFQDLWFSRFVLQLANSFAREGHWLSNFLLGQRRTSTQTTLLVPQKERLYSRLRCESFATYRSQCEALWSSFNMMCSPLSAYQTKIFSPSSLVASFHSLPVTIAPSLRVPHSLVFVDLLHLYSPCSVRSNLASAWTAISHSQGSVTAGRYIK